VTVGSWEPAGKPKSDSKLENKIRETLLDCFVALGSQPEMLELTSELTPAEVSEGAPLMTLPASAWDFLKGRDTASLTGLVRFFTVAENQLPGWSAGSKSPVIALVSILKERGEFTTELRKWVKSNTDNRYLPYGSAL